VVLAGKGHETYQEIKGVKYPFDEKLVVNELLLEMNGEKNGL
jgi:UDP-N-acetylmuramoyl-L-alanyl-D-glutamate--2,6-diaminopimelate ligase